MIFKQVKHIKSQEVYSKNKWEQVPDEDLWEDGTLGQSAVRAKVLNKVFRTGEYILVREVSDDNEHRNS